MSEAPGTNQSASPAIGDVGDKDSSYPGAPKLGFMRRKIKQMIGNLERRRDGRRNKEATFKSKV
jgi:hypothetical protein